MATSVTPARRTAAPPAEGATRSTSSARRRRRRNEVWLEWAVGAGAVIAFLLLWELAAARGWIDRRILNPPSQIWSAGYELFTEQDALTDVRITVQRFLAGLIVGSVFGTAFGLVNGLFRWPRVVSRPFVQFTYALPRIALFPIMLIMLGNDERTYLIAIALGPFFTMLIASQDAVMHIDSTYFEVAESFELSKSQLYRWVVLPATAPSLLSGLRISLGLAMLGTTAVEFLQAPDGIGHVIWRSWQLLSLRKSMAALIIVAIISAGFFVAVNVAERLLLPWKRR